MIQRFTDINHLYNYYCKTFYSEHPDRTIIHPGSDSEDKISQLVSLYPTLEQSIADVRQNYSDSDIVVYCISKTSYRKSIHPDLPNALYKRYFNALKNHGYITLANGFFVILNFRELTQDLYHEITSTYDIDTNKVLSELLKSITDQASDLEYYTDYIQKLEKQNAALLAENEDLKSQILNTKLSTWY